MSAIPDVGVAIIGYGAMGKAHAYGYRGAEQIRALPVRPRLRVIAGRNADAVALAAERYGVDAWVTDWRAAVEHSGVEIVDICTPPGTHREIVCAAAELGKAVICEKPLSTSYADALKAVAAARASGVLTAVGFNYRRLPAIALMKQLVDEGRIGDVQVFRATWLSDEFVDPEIPFDWRFERAMGGTTIADLGSHLVDLATWIVGEIAEVSAQSTTFTSTRLDGDAAGRRDVEIDDASSALLRFASGASGTLEVARVCPRRPCDFTVEMNGTLGTLAFDYSRLNELWYGDARDEKRLYGLRRIRAEEPSHPYATDWWGIGQGVGYGSSFVNQAADHLAQWPDGPWTPDLCQGLRVQAVCEAMERSAASRRWVAVSEVVGL